MGENDACVPGSTRNIEPAAMRNRTDVKELEYFMEDLPLDNDAALTASGISESAELVELRIVRQRGLKSIVGVGVCCRLRSLMVAECSLKSLDGAEECRCLESVYAHGNAIECLDVFVAPHRFERLTELWLNDNHISCLDDLKNLSGLRALNVAGNRLISVPDIAPNTLKYLNVAGNPIERIDDIAVRARLETLTCRDAVHGGVPFSRSDCYRSYIVKLLPKLRSLDECEISSEERARTDEAHEARALRYRFHSSLIRAGYTQAKREAMVQLRRLRRVCADDFLREESNARLNDIKDLRKLMVKLEWEYQMCNQNAFVDVEKFIAQSFRDAEIVAHTIKEERFARAKSTLQTPDIDAHFRSFYSVFIDEVDRVRQALATHRCIPERIDLTHEHRSVNIGVKEKLSFEVARQYADSYVENDASQMVEVCLENANLNGFEYSDRLRLLDVATLNYNYLPTIKDFAVCRRLRHLSLEGNSHIYLEGLSLLRELRVLNLRDCGIRKLSHTCFKSLTKLEIINLEENRIRSLSALVKCHNLREIFAAHNELSSTADLTSLVRLSNLKVLSIIGTPVTFSKEYPNYLVFKLPQLQILDAAMIDEETRQNAAKVYTGRLTEDMLQREEPNRNEQINLSSLELTLLDHHIVSSRFQSVKHLNLEKNNLNDVSALRALPHLEKLHLRHNRINVAFGRPGAFGNLKFLDLSSNNISSLGTLCISSCRNLRTLFLCNNFLTRLDGINQLKSLKTLKADRNKLCRMDAQTFEGCDRLKFVSLRRNALRTLGHLSTLFSVRELHLQDNHIDNEDELRWLTSLSKLKSLSLSGNDLNSSSDIYRQLSVKCSMNLARSGCILHINKNTTVTPHCDVGLSR